MVFLYICVGLIAVLFLFYEVRTLRERDINPSIDHYRRAMDRLSAMSDHVKVVEEGTRRGETAPRTVRDIPVASRTVAAPPLPVGPRGRDRAPAAAHSAVAGQASRSDAAPDGSRPPERPTTVAPRWVAALLGIVLLAGALAGVLVLTASSPNKRGAPHVARPAAAVAAPATSAVTVPPPVLLASVPNVSKPPEDARQAESALRKAGFSPRVRHVKATTITELALEGVVRRQLPRAGSMAAKKSSVTIEVVSGVSNTAIPSAVVGESPAAAGATLAGAQLRVGETIVQYSANVAAGQVFATAPDAPGQSLPVGTAVNLVVSAGPSAVVPELVGDGLRQARRALHSAGLVMGRVLKRAGANHVVLEQAARAGRTLRPGAAVSVVVGSGTPAR